MSSDDDELIAAAAAVALAITFLAVPTPCRSARTEDRYCKQSLITPPSISVVISRRPLTTRPTACLRPVVQTHYFQLKYDLIRLLTACRSQLLFCGSPKVLLLSSERVFY